MKRSWKFIIVLALVAVIGGTGTTGWMRASTARIHHACDIGNQRTYRLAYVAGDAVSPTSAFGAQSHDARSDSQFDTQIGADLIITTAACDATGSSQIWNVVQPSILLSGTQSDTVYRTMLTRDLSHPYAVRVASDGAVRFVGHDPAVGPLGFALVRRIASVMQVVAPSAPSLVAQRWNVVEPCVCGDRKSAYALEPWIANPTGTASLAFHRTTGAVIDTPTTSRFDIGSTFRDSSFDSGRFALDGYLESLDSNDIDETQTQKNTVARNRVLMRIERESDSAVAAASIPALTDYAQHVLARAKPLYVAADPKRVRERALIAMLGDETPKSLSKSLDAMQGLDASRVPGTLVSALGALFALHRTTIARFESRLDTMKQNPAAFVAVMRGLVGAQTQASQLALARALLRHASDESGAEIATTLGFMPAPSARVVAALETVADRPVAAAQSAELTLGSIAYTVADTDAPLSQRIAKRAAVRFAALSTAAGKRTEMLAMGNAGNAVDLPVVIGALQQRDPSVRSAATLALRRQSSSDADAALRALLDDRDTTIRLSAASAFAQREPGPDSYSALFSATERDSSPTVRTKALEALANARDQHPDALDRIRDAAAHDPNAGVRRNAQNMLDAIPPEESQGDASLSLR